MSGRATASTSATATWSSSRRSGATCRASLWAFDTTDRILFVSDAFAYLHYHKRGDAIS